MVLEYFKNIYKGGFYAIFLVNALMKEDFTKTMHDILLVITLLQLGLFIGNIYFTYYCYAMVDIPFFMNSSKKNK